MIQGRSVRLFLVDGTPNGLITAEIMNWTGHVLTGPRTKLAELVQRPESGRTGVYFLVGSDPDGGPLPMVYVGESDDVGNRLKQHNRSETSGGKDFWERVCLITSKDQNLTKAHVKYLESQLIRSVTETGRCKVVNGTAHEYVSLPESDQADMAFFVEQLRTILPVLGFDFLKTEPIRQARDQQDEQTDESPRFVFRLPTKGIVAHAIERDGEFIVLEGSAVRGEWEGVLGGYQSLYDQLCVTGVLVSAGDGKRRFAKNAPFTSPSAAAAVVAGRTANGRVSWLVEASGMTYGQWQEQQVNEASQIRNDNLDTLQAPEP
ncbi:GIY-YIG nuclease family protein [Neopusillimonas maritima]|uniref:Endonuclease n=1 Tax=Neopusillimonas maritima TaxID=2026239 RepID=A0ABX9MWK4_9BURK|nr:GIY-YIG nuclease family protein [Neopusillimonas maritima]RII83259.1 endonuclease [Neopusillimonas maritima]